MNVKLDLKKKALSVEQLRKISSISDIVRGRERGARYFIPINEGLDLDYCHIMYSQDLEVDRLNVISFVEERKIPVYDFVSFYITTDGKVMEDPYGHCFSIGKYEEGYDWEKDFVLVPPFPKDKKPIEHVYGCWEIL